MLPDRHRAARQLGRLNALRRTSPCTSVVNGGAATGRDYPVLRVRAGRAAQSADDRDRPAALCLGRLQRGHLAARRPGGRRDHLSLQRLGRGTRSGRTPPLNPAWIPTRTIGCTTQGVPTAVYAAIAAGHSATPCDWQVTGCAVPAFPPGTPKGTTAAVSRTSRDFWRIGPIGRLPTADRWCPCSKASTPGSADGTGRVTTIRRIANGNSTCASRIQ